MDIELDRERIGLDEVDLSRMHRIVEGAERRTEDDLLARHGGMVGGADGGGDQRIEAVAEHDRLDHPR